MKTYFLLRIAAPLALARRRARRARPAGVAAAAEALEVAQLTSRANCEARGPRRAGSSSAPRSAWATTPARSTPRSPGSSRSC